MAYPFDEWDQLHGYYLSRESAERHADARRRGDRARLAPEDRPRYRVRSKKAGPRGMSVSDVFGAADRADTRRVAPGESVYWIEVRR